MLSSQGGKARLCMCDQVQAEIPSERLILRPWCLTDAKQLFALFNNWEVVRWLSLPPWPYTLEDASSYIDEALNRRSKEAEESYAVTLNAEVIGGHRHAASGGQPLAAHGRPELRLLDWPALLGARLHDRGVACADPGRLRP